MATCAPPAFTQLNINIAPLTHSNTDYGRRKTSARIEGQLSIIDQTTIVKSCRNVQAAVQKAPLTMDPNKSAVLSIVSIIASALKNRGMPFDRSWSSQCLQRSVSAQLHPKVLLPKNTDIKCAWDDKSSEGNCPPGVTIARTTNPLVSRSRHSGMGRFIADAGACWPTSLHLDAKVSISNSWLWSLWQWK